MGENPVVPISDSISKALTRLFKVGGFALAFGFGGLLLIVIANFSTAELSFPMFIAGCLLTFTCLAYFLVSSLKSRQVAQRIKDDLPLLDSLQKASLQVIEFASISQAFAFKHLAKIQKAVEVIGPTIEEMPVVGPVIKKAGLTDAAKLSSVIVGATDNTKEIVNGLQQAIRSGDLKAIKSYTQKLEAALVALKTALKVEG
jgi:hypothetical protein